MDGVAIQAKVNYGYKKAAQYLGLPYGHYRPITTGPALASANLIDTLKLTFAQGANYSKPSATNKSEYVGYYDPTTTQAGDYLSSVTNTFFIAAQQPILPFIIVNCDRVINISRPPAQTGVGQIGYGGDAGSGTETTLLTGWPASCQQGTKGEKGDVTLPGDVRDPWWNLRLPSFAGLLFQTDDIITDDIGRRYSISSAELSAYGWRITARQNQV